MSLINDARFSRLHTDPRFQRQPKKERRVVVDKRFSAMLNDESFQEKAPVDRYGRKVPKKTKAKKRAAEGSAPSYARLYSLEGEDLEGLRATRPEKDRPNKAAAADRFQLPDQHASSEDDDEQQVAELDREGWDCSEEEPRSDDEELPDDASDMTQSASDLEEEDDEQAAESSVLVEWLEKTEGVTRVKDGTHRLAVCNCEWDQMRAVDLFVLLRSFLPAGGRLESVSVYPSDFGEQRMAEERTVGPTPLLSKQRSGKEGDGEASAADAKTANENLRQYELDRLKYFFAVVVCDSTTTADHLYGECDGAEFESSSLPLDLRFIPDDMHFTKPTRDVATAVPPKYKAPSFMCTALQQSAPKLSWDNDDVDRQAAMKRDFSKAEVKEMEFAAYLASSSGEDSGSDDGVEEYVFEGPRAAKSTKGGMADLLKKLRSGGGSNGIEDVEKEMTFAADDAGNARKKYRKEPTESKSVFELEEEKRKRKRKEKRDALAADTATDMGSNADDFFGSGSIARRGRAARATGESEDDDLYGNEDDDELAADPFFAEAMAEREAEESQERHAQKDKRSSAAGGQSSLRSEETDACDTKTGRGRKRKKGNKARGGRALSTEEEAEEARRRAELELLMMGDNEDEGHERRRGYDMKQLELSATQADRLTHAKGRKKKRAAAAAAATNAREDGFELDLADNRFNSIYTSSEFAIDPTDPKFRRTAGSEALLGEIQKRHRNSDAARQPNITQDATAPGSIPAPQAGGLWSLVSAVKAKAAKHKAKSGEGRAREQTQG